MFVDRSTRRGFAAHLAALLAGLGFAGIMAATPASAAQSTVPPRNCTGMENPPARDSSRR